MSQERKRALVTGSTGFIGSHLIKHLLAAGWEVHALCRAPNGSAGAVPGVRSHSYDGSINEVIDAVEASHPDVVFHLAALCLAQHTSVQISPLIAANILLGTQLLEAMSLTGITNLVNTGTYWQHFQSDSYNPVNLYAATKEAYVAILTYYAETSGIRVVTLSLFDSYGPGDVRKKLLRLLLDALNSGETMKMSGGDQILDLVHVDDICRAFLRAATVLEDPEQVSRAEYAVSGGERMSLREIVAALERVAGKKINIEWGARPYRPREVMTLWDGVGLPGWKPQITLREGFRALLEENQR